MASFVGHSMAAVAAYKSMEKLIGTNPLSKPWDLWVPAFLGLLPDLDIIIFMASGLKSDQAHRGISHSFFFCFFYAAAFSLAFFLFKRNKPSISMALSVLFMFFLSAGTHPILDYLMARGPRLPLFWPITFDKFISPVQLIPTAYYSLSLKRIMEIFVMIKSLKGYALECMQFLPLILIHSTSVKTVKWVWIIISAAGFLITFLIYDKRFGL